MEREENLAREILQGGKALRKMMRELYFWTGIVN
jgi:hypothetical protein